MHLEGFLLFCLLCSNSLASGSNNGEKKVVKPKENRSHNLLETETRYKFLSKLRITMPEQVDHLVRLYSPSSDGAIKVGDLLLDHSVIISDPLKLRYLFHYLQIALKSSWKDIDRNSKNLSLNFYHQFVDALYLLKLCPFAPERLLSLDFASAKDVKLFEVQAYAEFLQYYMDYGYPSIPAVYLFNAILQLDSLLHLLLSKSHTAAELMSIFEARKFLLSLSSQKSHYVAVYQLFMIPLSKTVRDAFFPEQNRLPPNILIRTLETIDRFVSEGFVPELRAYFYAKTMSTFLLTEDMVSLEFNDDDITCRQPYATPAYSLWFANVLSFVQPISSVLLHSILTKVVLSGNLKCVWNTAPYFSCDEWVAVFQNLNPQETVTAMKVLSINKLLLLSFLKSLFLRDISQIDYELPSFEECLANKNHKGIYHLIVKTFTSLQAPRTDILHEFALIIAGEYDLDDADIEEKGLDPVIVKLYTKVAELLPTEIQEDENILLGRVVDLKPKHFVRARNSNRVLLPRDPTEILNDSSNDQVENELHDFSRKDLNISALKLAEGENIPSLSKYTFLLPEREKKSFSVPHPDGTLLSVTEESEPEFFHGIQIRVLEFKAFRDAHELYRKYYLAFDEFGPLLKSLFEVDLEFSQGKCDNPKMNTMRKADMLIQVVSQNPLLLSSNASQSFLQIVIMKCIACKHAPHIKEFTAAFLQFYFSDRGIDASTFSTLYSQRSFGIEKFEKFLECTPKHTLKSRLYYNCAYMMLYSNMKILHAAEISRSSILLIQKIVKVFFSDTNIAPHYAYSMRVVVGRLISKFLQSRDYEIICDLFSSHWNTQILLESLNLLCTNDLKTIAISSEKLGILSLAASISSSCKLFTYEMNPIPRYSHENLVNFLENGGLDDEELSMDYVNDFYGFLLDALTSSRANVESILDKPSEILRYLFDTTMNSQDLEALNLEKLDLEMSCSHREIIHNQIKSLLYFRNDQINALLLKVLHHHFWKLHGVHDRALEFSSQDPDEDLNELPENSISLNMLSEEITTDAICDFFLYFFDCANESSMLTDLSSLRDRIMKKKSESTNRKVTIKKQETQQAKKGNQKSEKNTLKSAENPSSEETHQKSNKSKAQFSEKKNRNKAPAEPEPKKQEESTAVGGKKSLNLTKKQKEIHAIKHQKQSEATNQEILSTRRKQVQSSEILQQNQQQKKTSTSPKVEVVTVKKKGNIAASVKTLKKQESTKKLEKQAQNLSLKQPISINQSLELKKQPQKAQKKKDIHQISNQSKAQDPKNAQPRKMLPTKTPEVSLANLQKKEEISSNIASYFHFNSYGTAAPSSSLAIGTHELLLIHAFENGFPFLLNEIFYNLLTSSNYETVKSAQKNMWAVAKKKFAQEKGLFAKSRVDLWKPKEYSLFSVEGCEFAKSISTALQRDEKLRDFLCSLIHYSSEISSSNKNVLIICKISADEKSIIKVQSGSLILHPSVTAENLVWVLREFLSLKPITLEDLIAHTEKLQIVPPLELEEKQPVMKNVKKFEILPHEIIFQEAVEEEIKNITDEKIELPLKGSEMDEEDVEYMEYDVQMIFADKVKQKERILKFIEENNHQIDNFHSGTYITDSIINRIIKLRKEIGILEIMQAKIDSEAESRKIGELCEMIREADLVALDFELTGVKFGQGKKIKPRGFEDCKKSIKDNTIVQLGIMLMKRDTSGHPMQINSADSVWKIPICHNDRTDDGIWVRKSKRFLIKNGFDPLKWKVQCVNYAQIQEIFIAITRKTIITHNGLMDTLHLLKALNLDHEIDYTRSIRDIQMYLAEKRMTIYDTKVLHQRTRHWTGKLEDIAKSMFPPQKLEVGNKHDASFDAFQTGHVFRVAGPAIPQEANLFLETKFGAKSSSSSDSDDYSSISSSFESLMQQEEFVSSNLHIDWSQSQQSTSLPQEPFYDPDFFQGYYNPHPYVVHMPFFPAPNGYPQMPQQNIPRNLNRQSSQIPHRQIPQRQSSQILFRQVSPNMMSPSPNIPAPIIPPIMVNQYFPNMVTQKLPRLVPHNSPQYCPRPKATHSPGLGTFNYQRNFPNLETRNPIIEQQNQYSPISSPRQPQNENGTDSLQFGISPRPAPFKKQ